MAITTGYGDDLQASVACCVFICCLRVCVRVTKLSVPLAFCSALYERVFPYSVSSQFDAFADGS